MEIPTCYWQVKMFAFIYFMYFIFIPENWSCLVTNASLSAVSELIKTAFMVPNIVKLQTSPYCLFQSVYVRCAADWFTFIPTPRRGNPHGPGGMHLKVNESLLWKGAFKAFWCVPWHCQHHGLIKVNQGLSIFVNTYIHTYMTAVVGKSTCSGFWIVLYMFCHGQNYVRNIYQGDFSLNSPRISDRFDTKFTTVVQHVQIEQNLQKFEDQKFANFLNLEQVNFRVALVT